MEEGRKERRKDLLYKRLCLSVCPSVCWFVGLLFYWSIGLSIMIKLKSGKTSILDTFWAAAPRGPMTYADFI